MTRSLTKDHFPNPHPLIGVVAALTIENDGPPRPATLKRLTASKWSKRNGRGPILRAQILDESNGQTRSYEMAPAIIEVAGVPNTLHCQWWSVSWHTKVGGQTILVWKPFKFEEGQDEKR